MNFKRFVILCCLAIAGIFAWRITDKLSAESMSMAVGIFLGVLATIPIGLILLFVSRRGPAQPPENYRQLERQQPPPNLYFIGSVNVNQGEQKYQQNYRVEEPSTAVPRAKALATKPEPLTIESSHEWQDEPYPTLKR